MARLVAAAGIAIALLSGCELLPIGPAANSGIVRGDWVWPTPAPLPPGAVAVPIDVQPVPAQVLPDAIYGACPEALLGPVLVEHRPGENPPIRYLQGDQEVGIVWQAGFSARLNPALEIVAPDGTVIARQGELSRAFGGGIGAEGDERFHVCVPEYAPRRRDAP